MRGNTPPLLIRLRGWRLMRNGTTSPHYYCSVTATVIIISIVYRLTSLLTCSAEFFPPHTDMLDKTRLTFNDMFYFASKNSTLPCPQVPIPETQLNMDQKGSGLN